MKKDKLKIGLTWGAFDIFHIGHLNLLKNAKNKCDILIVCVSDDEYIKKVKEYEPFASLEDRLKAIRNIEFVDCVDIQSLKFTKEEAIKKYKPDVLFVGDDWTSKTYKGEGLGVSVAYLPHTKGISSTLKQAIKNLKDCKAIFDELRIPFCLWGGTMLGAYRDGNFIPKDEDDTDIRMDEKYSSYEKEIFGKFKEIGFKKKRNYHFRGKWIGGSVIRGKNHIDMGFFYWKGKDVYTLRKSKTDKRGFEASVYPRYFFEKFDNIFFQGI